MNCSEAIRFLDDLGRITRVDVVDDLAALVPEPPMLLEAHGTLHGRHATGR